MPTPDLSHIIEALRPFAVPVGSLKIDPANARKHDKTNLAAIRASLEAFGQRLPLIVRKDGMVVEVGNGRLMVAKRMKWKHIAALVVDEPEEIAAAFAIADNRTAELATWDRTTLEHTLAALARHDAQLAMATGFTGNELEAMIAAANGAGGAPVPTYHGDPDDVPDDAPTRCKVGEVWRLGNHRMMCADSTDQASFGQLLGEERVDLFFTDPPYGVSYADKNAFLNAFAKGNAVQERILNDHMKPEEMNEFWFKVLQNMHSFSTDQCSYYICSPQGGDLMMMMSIIRANWQLKHMLIWVKNNHVLGRCDYNYKHEPILFGWKEGGTHDFVGGGRCKTSVWDFNKPTKNDLHPTMKPVELCEEAILNSSRIGQIVCDPFLGSGSTLIAAEKAGRRCYGLELDPKYADVVLARWEKFTGRQAELVSGG